MFLTDRKLENRIEELKEYRYRDRIQMEFFYSKEEVQEVESPLAPDHMEEEEKISVGDNWSGRDRYLWLHRQVEIPIEWKGKKVVGLFDFGNTGVGNNSGFESLLYLNKQPYQGVDVNHKEVFFQPDMYGKTINLDFRLWSGLEGGGKPTVQEHKIRQACLSWLDEKTDDLYYLSSAILQTIQILDKNDSVKYQLRECLNHAFSFLDWTEPGSESFYESVCQAADWLNETIEKMEKKETITVSCVGHTHIDVAWLWRLKHTREKCSRSFSTVLRLMELFPEYIFLQTQPQLYAYIKEDFGEIYEKIKERVKEGRWEAGGAMWVEADCNLISGESLTRQILLGKKFFKEEFGKDCDYLWLPDVFGYSWALPQILKKSGIKTFMTTKISWNQYNRMPHDTFYWKGLDGTEIATHFITTPEPESEEGSWFYTYNGKLYPKTVQGVWNAYTEKEMNQDLLISYGFGDGGGGVNRDMLEYRRRMDKIPGLPAVKTSTAKDYFDQLEKNMKETDHYIHTWDGELYLEYHRGTYTSQAYNKRMNRKMEFLYRETEWMAVMEELLEGRHSGKTQQLLNQGWQDIMTNQFHDIIPGSSIHEVYEDSRIAYEKIERLAEEVRQNFFMKILEKDETHYSIINNGSWERSEVVCLPEIKEGAFRDESGAILPTQICERENCTLIQVDHIPPMGYKTIQYEEKSEETLENAMSIHGKAAETPYYVVEWNEQGQISRLYDKTYQREVLEEGGRGNVLQIFEDKPLGNDAWDIDLFYQEKMQEITELTKFQVMQDGPLQMKLLLEWNYHASNISQEIVFYQNSRRIDFKTKVDFHEQHKLLKAAFMLAIHSNYGTYDIQYGNVKRPNHWNTSWDQARFESVAHRFVDLSEYNYGVSLLNDCKYGHDIYKNVMRITLLKSATHPDYLQDQGSHEFTYSLFPHEGEFIKGRTVNEAYALNQPCSIYKGKIKLPFSSFVKTNCDTIEIDAIKWAENGQGVIIRFHDFSGGTTKAALTLGLPVKTWRETNLMEEPVDDIIYTSDITIQVKPFEIKTLLLEL